MAHSNPINLRIFIPDKEGLKDLMKGETKSILFLFFCIYNK